MSISLDVGTMFLVKGRLNNDGNPEFYVERNAFLEAATTDDTESILKENNWSYASHNNKYYILGEDAIKLKNLLTVQTSDANIVATRVGELRRPMKDGVLNTSEEKLSVAIIQKLIANLLGPPAYEREILCFCVPGDPIDRNFTVLFHKTMLTNFLKSLGYEVECIPEALSIIFSERPVAHDDEEGEMPFTGIGIAYGAGMCNISFALKKVPLISFSIARSGDWIDKESAKTSGIDVASMTKFKENHLNLDDIDFSDIKQASLDIFYQNMIENSLSKFAEKFNQLDNKIEFPLEIVIAGGTSMVPGFLNKFNTVLNSLDLPFKVKGVRHAANPFYSVANGCLVKAISIENKRVVDILPGLKVPQILPSTITA